MKTIAIKLSDELLAEIQHAAKKEIKPSRQSCVKSLRTTFLRKSIEIPAPVLTLPAILADLCKARRTLQRIRHTWMVTEDETAGHIGYRSIGGFPQFAGQVSRLDCGPMVFNSTSTRRQDRKEYSNSQYLILLSRQE